MWYRKQNLVTYNIILQMSESDVEGEWKYVCAFVDVPNISNEHIHTIFYQHLYYE